MALGEGPRRPSSTTFARAFTEAVGESGRSLTWLRQRLANRGVKVALSTLSYWRSGQRRPEGPQSIEALAEIESILGLSVGRLTSAVEPSRRTGPLGPEADVDELFQSGISDALVELGLPDAQEQTWERTVHSTIDVDASGNDYRATSRTMLTALKPMVRAFPMVLVGPGPIRGWARFTPQAGCSLGRLLEWPERGVFAAEMVLDRPLEQGESTVFEVCVDLPDDPHTFYEHYAVRPIRELVVWVRFHPDRTPGTATIYSETEGGYRERPVDLTGARQIHHAVTHFGPGRVGISWDW